MRDPLHLAKYKIPIRQLPELQSFTTRAGQNLSFRHYPSWSESFIFIFHGIGSDSKYLVSLAHRLQQQTGFQVVTPDFRGHGISLESKDPGPSDLEIDFEELCIYFKMRYSLHQIYLIGHSLGAGFVLRLSTASRPAFFYSLSLALCPYLPPRLGIHFSDYGGWITDLQDEQKVVVNMSDFFKTGKEKLEYSYQYMQAIAVQEEFLSNAENCKDRLLVICGAKDQVFQSDKQKQFFLQHGVSFLMEPKGDHMGLVASRDSIDFIVDAFIQKIGTL